MNYFALSIIYITLTFKTDSNDILLKELHEKDGRTKENTVIFEQQYPDMPIRKHQIFSYSDTRFIPYIFHAIALRMRDKKAIILYENPKGFEEFAREEGYIIESNISVEKFLTLFLDFTGVDYGSKLISLINDIRFNSKESKKDREFKETFRNRISPPKVLVKDGKTKVEFWTWNCLNGGLFKWELVVSRDYGITYKNGIVRDEVGDYSHIL